MYFLNLTFRSYDLVFGHKTVKSYEGIILNSVLSKNTVI